MTIAEKVTDLRLNTIDGLCSVIEKMVKGKQDKPSPLMEAALKSVVDLIEQHGGYDAGISRAMDKVRDACGIKKESEDETQAEANQAIASKTKST
jgi:hypothetical protein